MKHIDLFCASPASTAICSSMDHRSIVDRPAPRRHQTRLGDSKTRTPVVPCSSSHQLLPIHPKTSNNNKNRGRSSMRDNKTINQRNSAANSHDHDQQLMKTTPTGTGSSLSYQLLKNETRTQHKFFDLLSDSDDHLKSIHVVPENASLKSTTVPPRTQVVELMVSIHCKGCEGKVRRHISRLEGVKSVSIDLTSKKVTVVGDVTPLQVLTSISRVKIAQFWPYAETSTIPSSTSPLFSSSQMS